MDFLNSEFIATMRKLISELRIFEEHLSQLRQSINQHVEAIRQHHKQSANQSSIHPLEFEKIIAKYEQPIGDKSENDNRNYRTQRSIKRATWFAFIAAAAYAAIAACQLGQMRIATQQATQSANMQEQTMRLDHRAELGINISHKLTFYENQPIVIPLELVNNGKSAARNIQGFVDVTFIQTTENEPQGRTSQNPQGDIHLGGAVYPAGTQYIDAEMIQDKKAVNYTKTIQTGMDSGRLRIETFGKITYDDMFGSHWIQFCFLSGALRARPMTDQEKRCNLYGDTDHEENTKQ